MQAKLFYNLLDINYWKPLLNGPSSCDCCCAYFSFVHALVCRKAGLIIQCHNEVRDAVDDVAALV